MLFNSLSVKSNIYYIQNQNAWPDSINQIKLSDLPVDLFHRSHVAVFDINKRIFRAKFSPRKTDDKILLVENIYKREMNTDSAGKLSSSLKLSP